MEECELLKKVYLHEDKAPKESSNSQNRAQAYKNMRVMNTFLSNQICKTIKSHTRETQNKVRKFVEQLFGLFDS